MLETSEVSVNSALQRARATLGGQLPSPGRDRAPAPRSPREREIVSRFVDAFEAADIERLVALLTDDAWMTMPPEPLEYQGHAAIAEFYLTRTWWGARPVKLVPTRANGQPAFGYYLPDAHAPIAHAHGLIVLTLAGDKICAITRFGDNSLFPQFGLPRTLRNYGRAAPDLQLDPPRLTPVMLLRPAETQQPGTSRGPTPVPLASGPPRSPAPGPTQRPGQGAEPAGQTAHGPHDLKSGRRYQYATKRPLTASDLPVAARTAARRRADARAWLRGARLWAAGSCTGLPAGDRVRQGCLPGPRCQGRRAASFYCSQSRARRRQ